MRIIGLCRQSSRLNFVDMLIIIMEISLHIGIAQCA